MFTLIALIALAGAQVSQSEIQHRYTDEYDACRNRDSSNAALGHCLAAELVRQEKQLNTAYRRAVLEEREAGREGLEKSQRSWIQFRNHNCAAKTVNGSGAAISQISCQLEMTVTRIAELETFGDF